MNNPALMQSWILGCALTLAVIGPAASDEPKDPKVTDVANATVDSQACESKHAGPRVAADEQGAPPCSTPKEGLCPCADEYAAAVRAFNERSGAPLTAWLRCEVRVSGTGGLIGYMTKADPQPPQWVTVILVSMGRWGYGHGIARRCEAWMYEGLAGDWGRPPLGEPTHGGHRRISEAEVLACTQLIEATAKCPD